MSETAANATTTTSKRDWHSMSGILKIASEEASKGYNFKNFLSGLVGSILIDPIRKKMNKMTEYFSEINASHDDNIEVPVGTKTVLGEDFSMLYNGGSNGETVYKGANGSDIACYNPACSYDTELYTIRSDEWVTADQESYVSDEFKVCYEMALLTKKYADMYSENWEGNDDIFNKFKESQKATPEYKAAYAMWKNALEPETAMQYEEAGNMAAAFEAEYFKDKNNDPEYKKMYDSYFKSYNDNLANEYMDKLSQYKDYCDSHDIKWESVLMYVCDEMQTEVYEYDKAASHVLCRPDAADEKNVANRGYLMLEAAMKANGVENIHHPACITYEYGIGKLSEVTQGAGFMEKFSVAAVNKFTAVKAKMDKSAILHPIKNFVVPGVEGLDAMVGKGTMTTESGVESDIKEDENEVDGPEV